MSPVLIDSKSLFKLGFYSSLSAVLIFCSGFIFGYQKAEQVRLVGTSTEFLTIPQVEARSLDDYEPVTPDVIAAGADIDVDLPSTEEVSNNVDAESDSGDRIEQVPMHTDHANEPENKPQSTKVADKQKHLNTISTVAMDDVHNAVANVPVVKNQTTEQSKSKASDTTGIDTYDAADTWGIHFPSDFSGVKYTIQVGVYGNSHNARTMVDKLRADALPAYVYDYVNKKQQARYTVRFGFFENRQAAHNALDSYKANLKGDGYLVNFSAKSTSGLAVIDQAPAETPPQSPDTHRQQDSTS